ncbi:MAG: AMP-binding protein [Burkholderiales bacterium]
MTEYFDTLEIREPAAREEALLRALPRQIAHAKGKSAYFERVLAQVDASAVTSRSALAALPVTRKSELKALQAAAMPFGGLAARPLAEFPRVFMSPGPLYEPEGHRPDYWRMARPLYAAGFRTGELVHNTLSYHFTPAGAMLESGAHALGCTVFPAGTGQTEMQVQAINHLRPTGYIGTPSFLKIIIEKALETNVDIASMTKALVSGEALPPSLRQWLEAHGVRTTQTYASADLGNIAFESAAREGLILDEDVIVEIVRPGTSDPMPVGEVGEVVVTTLNPDYPLIRFATGDLSAILRGTSPCGRTNQRIRGWMGRADQTTKVKGMFVHPSQVAEVARRHPSLGRVRLVVDSVDGQDRMTLHAEVAGSIAGIDAALAESLRDVTKLRGEVVLKRAGELANDGKVIDDIRKYD